MLQTFRFLVFAAVLAIFPTAASATSGIALLIGNEKYDPAVGPLDTPAEDLELIKRSLLEVGLDESNIRILKDVSRIDMLTAVEDFANKARNLDNDEIAFFYYAGHGAKKPDTASGLHLIPVSARNVDDRSFWYETINFNRDVIQTFTNAGSRAAWVVAVDACRNELKLPSRNLGGGDRGFGAVPSSSGMLISFAADDNQTAKDKVSGSANSPYAMALAKYLRTPNQRISSVFGAVRPDVMERTGYVQEPVYTNKLNRDPVLIEINAKPPSPTPTPQPQPQPKPQPYSLVSQLQQEMADLGDEVRLAIGANDQGKTVDTIAMRWKKENGGAYSVDIARLFKAACLLGRAFACTDYGYLKDSGEGNVPVNLAEAVEYYIKGCEGESPVGCANLGYMYEKGRGTTISYSQAFRYYTMACDKGNSRGCTNLGYLYDMGNGVPKSYPRAVEFYQKGCDGDNSFGCSNLASMYENGLGVATDKSRALELYQKALRLTPGHQNALDGIARLKGANINPAKPKTLVQKLQDELSDLGSEVRQAIAANDNGAALDKIGMDWRSANGNAFNSRIARVFDAACQLGSGGACVDIGFIYEQGDAGFPMDLGKAVSFYRTACLANHYLGCANLGYMYEKGRGVPANDYSAVRYYRTACDGGNARGCTNLGLMYENGKGLSGSDFSKAVEYYRKGCDGGNNRGCTNLGYMYETGRGVARNDFTAVRYYTQACNDQDDRGCTNLGYMYDTGKGVSGGKDYTKAVQYYREGCDLGNGIGCSNLGSMYEEGLGGLSANRSEAIRLYRRAVELDPGYQKARDNLVRLGVTP